LGKSSWFGVGEVDQAFVVEVAAVGHEDAVGERAVGERHGLEVVLTRSHGLERVTCLPLADRAGARVTDVFDPVERALKVELRPEVRVP
jgi:hypothetical protein